MNASTAPKWIGAIATILDVLRRVFKEESKDSTSKFLNELRVEGVDLFTYILYAIICNRELQDLFGLNSLREITPEYLAATHFIPNPQPGDSSPEESRSDTAKRNLDAAEVDHGEFSFRFLSILSNTDYNLRQGWASLLRRMGTRMTISKTLTSIHVSFYLHQVPKLIGH